MPFHRAEYQLLRPAEPAPGAPAAVQVRSFGALREALLRARGLDTGGAVPVQVRGGLPRSPLARHRREKAHPGGGHAAHVRASVSGALLAAKGVLVGFFSKHHHGVFTHMGSNTHFHVVLPERPLMGHVDGVTLARGARVLLPAP